MARKSAIDRQRARLEAARDAQALAPEMMPDYLDVSGVRFYRPTVAHIWAGTRYVQVAKEREVDLYDQQLVLGYLLCHDQSTVRNRIFREFRAKFDALPELAEDFFTAHNLPVADTLEAISELMPDFFPQTATPMETPAEQSPPVGGVVSSTP